MCVDINHQQRLYSFFPYTNKLLHLYTKRFIRSELLDAVACRIGYDAGGNMWIGLGLV